MPYIPKDGREPLTSGVLGPTSPGELNFLFTSVIQRYLKHKTLNYGKINDVLGALEGAKMEFYRRVVVPYEDKKLAENGDVY